jgi:hypothetical protein
MSGVMTYAHLEEDELLRFIDGEEDERREAWTHHVGACAQCAGAAESLRSDAQFITLSLDLAALEEGGADAVSLFDPRVDAAVIPLRPRRRAVTPWLRAAAVIAALATPVAAIPSLRQWVVDAVSGPAADPAPAVLSAPEGAPEGTEIIRFVPAAGAFIVELEVVQSAGELRLERVTGAEAVLQPDAADGALPIVSAALLRIRNDAADAGGYTLRVPPTVSSVTVRIGSRSTVVERGQLDAGAAVPLH